MLVGMSKSHRLLPEKVVAMFLLIAISIIGIALINKEQYLYWRNSQKLVPAVK
jgi:hypothetical protein